MEVGKRREAIRRRAGRVDCRAPRSARKAVAENRGTEWANLEFFVGVEGGPSTSFARWTAPVFLRKLAYASDGAQGFWTIGKHRSAEAGRRGFVDRGWKLSVAIDRFAGQIGIRDAQGAWGVLSGNIWVTRPGFFSHRVITAFRAV